MYFLIFIFLLYYYIRGLYSCPCPIKNKYCNRYEIYGIQVNHFIVYFLLGFLYPNYFYFWQIMGLLWELIEFLPNNYPNIFEPIIGGCIDINQQNKYYVNIIDKWIYRSKTNFWHPKLSDIILNIIGFYLGKISFYKNG